jgi:copper transporter 1
MWGCTVNRVCLQQKPEHGKSGYCERFSVLKDLCLDMPGMKGCGNYTSMCSNVSVVQECDMKALPFPDSKELGALIQKMCDRMPMSECKKCINNNDMMTMMLHCDMMQVYSDLCKSMPNMGECAAWKTLCKAVPEWSLCSNTDGHNTVPEMRMYFHTGLVDYVLVEQWVPTNNWQYALTFVAIVLMGILYELLKVCRSVFEGAIQIKTETDSQQASHQHHEQTGLSSDFSETSWEAPRHDTKRVRVPVNDPNDPYVPPAPRGQPFRLSVELARGALSFVETAWVLY